MSGRRNSSRSATFQPSSEKTAIGTTVSFITPFSHAAAAFCCDASANASARSFVSAGKRSWRFSAVWPIDRRGLVDQPLGDEARVEVDVLAHRVVAHVLDAARDRDVGRAERDLAGGGGHGGERAGAHPVDGEAGHRLRQPREQRDVAAERQALVADLRGRGEHDVADPLRRDGRVAAQQLAHDLDGHVVGARAPELALRPGLAEGGAHAVDEDDLTEFPRHREPR